MARAKLIYNLGEEKDAFMCALKGQDLALVIWEIVYNLYKKIENEIAEKGLNGYDVLDRVMDEIGKELDNYGINIDELVK